MEDLMDTSDLVSDADFLPNAPMPTKSSGKGAPELLSDMSGDFQGLQPTCLTNASLQERHLPKTVHFWRKSSVELEHGWCCVYQGSSSISWL